MEIPNTLYMIAVGHDGVDPDDGPIIMETYVKKADQKTGEDHIKKFNFGRYGEVVLLKLKVEEIIKVEQ